MTTNTNITLFIFKALRAPTQGFERPLDCFFGRVALAAFGIFAADLAYYGIDAIRSLPPDSARPQSDALLRRGKSASPAKASTSALITEASTSESPAAPRLAIFCIASAASPDLAVAALGSRLST